MVLTPCVWYPQGYNATLLAYGQTGSGKSYSMVGYGPNKGLVPTLCERLFQDLRGTQDSRQCQVRRGEGRGDRRGEEQTDGETESQSDGRGRCVCNLSVCLSSAAPAVVLRCSSVCWRSTTSR